MKSFSSMTATIAVHYCCCFYFCPSYNHNYEITLMPYYHAIATPIRYTHRLRSSASVLNNFDNFLLLVHCGSVRLPFIKLLLSTGVCIRVQFSQAAAEK